MSSWCKGNLFCLYAPGADEAALDIDRAQMVHA